MLQLEFTIETGISKSGFKLLFIIILEMYQKEQEGLSFKDLQYQILSMPKSNQWFSMPWLQICIVDLGKNNNNVLLALRVKHKL